MDEGWRRKVYELKLAMRHDEAAALIRQAMEAGDMAAHVMLATMWSRVGMSPSDADALVDYVEANMNPEDIEAHLQLSAAYDLRLGSIPYEEKAVRCFAHLLKAGELGAGALNSLAIARYYRDGAIGVEVNRDEAVRWYKRAIEQGSIEAVHELQEYYKEENQQKASVTSSGADKIGTDSVASSAD